MDADPFQPQERAGWGRRLAAWLIDIVVFLLLLPVALMGLALLNDGRLSLRDTGFFIVVGCISLLWDIVWIASPLRGKPGHRFVGVRIVRVDGGRVSVVRAAVRWAARVSSFFLAGLPVVASAVTIAATPRRQAVHDLVAGTVAVRAGALERLRSPLAGPPVLTSPAPTAPPPPAPAGSRGPFL